MQDKDVRRPIIDPLLLALKSRRVLVALSALLIGTLTLAVPELSHVQAELLVLVITLAMAVIGGYSIEDAAAAARQQPPVEATDLRGLLREVLMEVLADNRREDVEF